MPLLRLDSGDWPTWIQAVTTILALVAAGYAAIQTHRTIRLEFSRDEERRIEELRREAHRVSMWLERNPEPTIGSLCRLYITNANSTPVYNANLVVEGQPLTAGLFTIPPSSEKQESGLGSGVANSIVAGEMDRTHNPYLDEAMNRIRLELVFSDSAEKRWARTLHGRLRPVADDYMLPAFDEDRRNFGYSQEEIEKMGSADA